MSLHDDEMPKRIDRYEPLKKLATGGMAEIYLAKQSGLEGFEKVVVLKRILPHLAGGAEFVNMFLDEARIAAKLSHPNVVQIYDLGKADDTFYIAMEYVSGRNVQHLINKQQLVGGHLPVEHVCRIIAGVCDGLHYAHARKDYDGKPLNIVHRDISPQNILVSFAGGVKVVDFGIAKASTQLAQTRAGVLKGKYAYMSPEQVRGSKVDHRSDIFAVGLVMYEMLTGARTFERDNSLKTLKAIVQEKPLNPREMNPDIPTEVIKILSKSLEKNPDRRYKSAQEFQLALEDWLEQSPKKSNNVRLSRFLYDLFDDELNSAEGTMVVKGVGQVIIPTSRQGNEGLKPAIEEEIDNKTLSAALVDVPANGPLKAATNRVRDELMAKAPPPPTPKPAPTVELDDDDGKTIPGVDYEEVERKRLERDAQKLKSAGRPTSPLGAPPPPPALYRGQAGHADALHKTLESDPEEQVDPDEDKTRAGVPMSSPQGAPFLKDHTRERQRPGARTGAPAPAHRMDAIAAPMASSDRAVATMSIPEDGPLDTLMASSPPTSAEPMLGSPAGAEMSPSRSASVAPQHDDTKPGAATPGAVPSPLAVEPVAVPDAMVVPMRSTSTRPAAWTALVASSIGMAAAAVLLFGVAAVAFPPAVPATAYGVVVVTSTPTGATVTVDGLSHTTPAQVAIPLTGGETNLSVSLPGHRSRTEAVAFAEGHVSRLLHVTLEAE